MSTIHHRQAATRAPQPRLQILAADGAECLTAVAEHLSKVSAVGATAATGRCFARTIASFRERARRSLEPTRLLRQALAAAVQRHAARAVEVRRLSAPICPHLELLIAPSRPLRGSSFSRGSACARGMR